MREPSYFRSVWGLVVPRVFKGVVCGLYESGIIDGGIAIERASGGLVVFQVLIAGIEVIDEILEIIADLLDLRSFDVSVLIISDGLRLHSGDVFHRFIICFPVFNRREALLLQIDVVEFLGSGGLGDNDAPGRVGDRIDCDPAFEAVHVDHIVVIILSGTSGRIGGVLRRLVNAFPLVIVSVVGISVA